MNRRQFLATAPLAPIALRYKIRNPNDRPHWHTPGRLGSLRHYRGPANECPYC